VPPTMLIKWRTKCQSEKSVMVSLPNMYVRVTLTSWSTNQTPAQVNLARLIHINQTKCLHNGSLAMASQGLADGPGPPRRWNQTRPKSLKLQGLRSTPFVSVVVNVGMLEVWFDL
jgi:hypothetical protein